MKNAKQPLYLLVGTVELLFLGLIYAWSIFKVPFSKIFTDWTIQQISMTFTISMIFFCLGGFFGGTLSKKVAVKVRLAAAGIMLFVGFFAVSMLNTADSAGSLIRIYIFYGAIGGTGVGIGYNAVISTVTKWFPDNVGLASGIMLMGFGLGGLALGSIVNGIINSQGIFAAFRIIAISIAVVVAIGVLVLRNPKDGEIVSKKELEAHAETEDPEAQGRIAVPTKDYTVRDMVGTKRFWVFFVWTIALNSAGLLVISSAANISVAFGGTVVLGLIVSLFNGVGRIFAGANFDKFGRKPATLVNTSFMLLAGILLIAGAFTKALALIVVGLVFVGIAYGGTPTLTSAYINKSFGAKNFAANFSVANFSLIPAAIIGPTCSAKLLESSGGSYTTNFYAIVIFSAIAVVLWAVLNGVSKKEG